MLYTRFYDQVLTEIAAGKVSDGINLLVGMLDTVNIGPGSLAQAKRELHGHSLARMLLEDPSLADAEARPNAIMARIASIGRTTKGADISSTGRRLFEVTSELTVARALRQRRQSYELKFARASQLGQKICVCVSGGHKAADQLNNADFSKATVIDTDDHRWTAAKSNPRFDLILAPDLFDRNKPSALPHILKSMATCLGKSGSIIIAALSPNHLGSGWRSACLNWDPHCHDEAALASLAAAAGLTARTYRDETDCVVWGELGANTHGN